MEQVPGPDQSPRPEEKLRVNKPNTWNNVGLNFSQARELFGKLNKARETVGYTRLEKSSKNFKGSLGLSQFSQLPDWSSGPKMDTRSSSMPENLEPIPAKLVT